MKRTLRFMALTLAFMMSIGIINVSAAEADNHLTRSEFAQMLWEANGRPEPSVKCPFSDVPSDSSAAITSLYENGVVSGVGNGLFAPNSMATIEMCYVMALRNFNLAPYNDHEYEKYSDGRNVSEWAQSAMSYMYETDVNKSNTLSNCKNGITYAEANALITRIKNNKVLDSVIKDIISRPEFTEAVWGIEFYLPETNEMVYSINREQYYRPASALKVFTAGTVYDALGADFRFHTPIYRTGPIENGVLKGDLVLQASGDLLLGGRVNSDGTINIPLTDHTYRSTPDAVPVSDNPLGSLYIFAEQIIASGITSIEGNIIVDDSLFPKNKDNLDGTGEYSISPIVINDNLIDIWVIPGKNEGDLATLQIMPETPYVTFVNEVKTVAPSEPSTGSTGVVTTGGRFSQSLVFENETKNPDGTYTVTLSGSIALNGTPSLNSYAIPEPERFTEAALKMVLEEKGIISNVDLLKKHDFSALSSNYTEGNKVAEIVSPALCDELLPMMKLSSNMHAVAWPYIIGAIAGDDSENAKMKGYEMEAELFQQTGVTTNSSYDKLYDALEVRYSPNDYINFLNHIYNEPYYKDYVSTLCIMGIDGHLNSISPDLSAFGYVFGKPGVAMAATPSPDGRIQPSITSTLAGFMELPDGRVLSFSIFTEYPTRMPNPAIAQIAIGDIINTVYEFIAAK